MRLTLPAPLIFLSVLCGCDQRILGEFGYNGNVYRASYEAEITIEWGDKIISSRRNIDSFEQNLPPGKHYISYSYNSYIALDSDTVINLELNHDGSLNNLSVHDVYQRDTDASGKVFCRQFSGAHFLEQHRVRVNINKLSERPPNDQPALPMFPPTNEEKCNALIRAGQNKTDIH